MINVDMNNCGHITMEVRVVGVRLWQFRVRVMLRVFQLAAMLAPRNVKINVELHS